MGMIKIKIRIVIISGHGEEGEAWQGRSTGDFSHNYNLYEKIYSKYRTMLKILTKLSGKLIFLTLFSILLLTGTMFSVSFFIVCY